MKILLTLATVIISLSAMAGSGLSGGGGSVSGGGGGGGGGTSTTNFPGILVTNTAYASNFAATGTGTNVFDVTLFTNGVMSYTSYMPTNTAPYYDNLNPTNAYVVTVIYTNGTQRGLLVGSTVLVPSANDQAGITLYYTNNGVGYVLPALCPKAAQAQPLTATFCVPLSPNATFTFTKVNTGTANSYITNTVLWRE